VISSIATDRWSVEAVAKRFPKPNLKVLQRISKTIFKMLNEINHFGGG
jgi:hypothetical protein